MADRWMEERDREWRDRDWRRSEQYGRRTAEGGRWPEERTWSGPGEGRGPQDDRTGPEPTGRYAWGADDYDAPSRLAYGGGSYGLGGAYGGRSPADRGQSFTAQDYTGGGYRGAEHGYAGRGDYATWAYDGDRSYNRDLERRYAGEMRRPVSGGTGGYDYERGYGDGGRGRDREGRAPFEERRDERGGGMDFLQRAGERISGWFRGESPMGGRREDDRRGEGGYYREDFGREARYIPERSFSGHGPRGYKRSDERISEDVHQRLTDDPYLDASNIHVDVRNGEVTLSGTVDNREAKHRAERTIEDLSGVGHVQNNLRVDQGASLTGSGGRGYGSSALEAEMRRYAGEADQHRPTQRPSGWTDS